MGSRIHVVQGSLSEDGACASLTGSPVRAKHCHAETYQKAVVHQRHTLQSKDPILPVDAIQALSLVFLLTWGASLFLSSSTKHLRRLLMKLGYSEVWTISMCSLRSAATLRSVTRQGQQAARRGNICLA